jgi:UTP--glucose-1-phosphate uridylyltransferase
LLIWKNVSEKVLRETYFMRIRKAVFPVAGFGTRFCQQPKAMPKELLPIVDKPLIQYARKRRLPQASTPLIFVTGRNKRAIEDHFDANNELETMLRSQGKDEQADMVRNIIPSGVEVHFCAYG